MFTKRCEIRWRDMDAFQHVNNSVYLTYLEELFADHMFKRYTLASEYFADRREDVLLIVHQDMIRILQRGPEHLESERKDLAPVPVALAADDRTRLNARRPFPFPCPVGRGGPAKSVIAPHMLRHGLPSHDRRDCYKSHYCTPAARPPEANVAYIDALHNDKPEQGQSI